MAASKNGNNIEINGAGNTLASITADIADTTFIEKTGTTPDVYTVKGNVVRILDIRTGGELTIGDSGDYTNDEELHFEQGAANRSSLYIRAGGTLNQYGDTIIDFSSNATAVPQDTYIYGKCTVLGDGTNNPIWMRYNRIRLYESSNNNTYTDDIWRFEEMTLGSPYLVHIYAFYFVAIGKMRSHIFKNITCDQSVGNNVAYYPFYIAHGMAGIENVTFEGINFEDVGYYAWYTNAMGWHLKDCTFGTTDSWKLYVVGGGGPQGYDASVRYGQYAVNPVPFLGQQFSYVDGCTFENEGSVNCCFLAYGHKVLFKDNTWETTSGNSMQVNYGGTALIWSGNTFTAQQFDLDYNGAIQWVFGLNLIINDEDGNAMEGATVIIEQKDGKEKFAFLTDASGKLDNVHSLQQAILTNKHQYGNNTTTNAEYWSDASNSTYHTVSVFKDGYRPYTENYVMSEDRSDTIQMVKIDAHSNTF